jgi:ribosome maturation factor RimP
MAATHTTERELQRQIARTVESGLPQVEVLAVELMGPDRFCVYVDHPAGVDHALCERVTDLLRDYLDRYTVDVSSPGFERPLRTPAHFRGAVGRRVAIRTAGDIGGRKRFRGEVAEAGERDVTVKAGADEIHIPYDAIVRGNLIDEGGR